MQFKLKQSGFWSKLAEANIRTKIIGIVAVCIFLAALSMVWYTNRDVSAALEHELREQGISMSQSLAEQSTNFVLTNDRFNLHNLIINQLESDHDISYIYISDTRDNIIVHSFYGGFPIDLIGINGVEPGEQYGIQKLNTDSGTILDISAPILDGKAGAVHIGLSENSINTTVAQHTNNILIWIVLIFVLGLSVSYGFASILTRPITSLAEMARAVGKGDFKWINPVWAKDEIGSLGTTFNEVSEELKRKESMRKHLLANIIDTQENERKRISRELHDETGQALTSLMVGLKSVENLSSLVEVKEKTSELRALAAQTLNDVHHLSTELRPSILDDYGLVAAIKKYINGFSNNMGLNVDFHCSELLDQRLSPEIELVIYRIVQEALTNIAKYAEATNVSVILKYRGKKLIAIIEDDGKGFDVDSVMSSAGEQNLGLFGMYERASLIGGKLTIESQLGGGTTIFLELPLN
ncbi:MAG: HAMP domain-containing protein [Dehalococcoidia bacterium]|nr:MAG: HAMP domain-containing protein [Dehalococcoidia bacterium]